MAIFWAMLIVFGMITADFFMPVLPSATLVTAAAGLVFGNPWLIGVLAAGAAGASWLGEYLGYRIFRSIRTRRSRLDTGPEEPTGKRRSMIDHPYLMIGRRIFHAVRTELPRRWPRLARALANRSVLGTVAKLERLLRHTVAKHPYLTTIVARFLPAGRTTLAWVAAGAGRLPYARMAALGGILWAAYTVSLGLVVAWIAGPGLQSLLGSVLSAIAVGTLLSWAARRWQQLREADLDPVVPVSGSPVLQTETVAVVPALSSLPADPSGPVRVR